jgi:SpoVK/Ycf46/Vps4 family AAA+-type ATPase
MPIAEDLDLLIRSRYPLIYLITSEEDRVESVLNQIAQNMKKKFFVWSCASGFGTYGQTGFDSATVDPLVLLDRILQSEDHSIYLLKDFHIYMEKEHAVIIRKLRETCQIIRNTYKTIFISSPVMKIPPELEKEMAVLDFPLPTFNELKKILDDLIASVRSNPRIVVDLPTDIHEKMVKAVLGLTENEAKRVFAKAIVNDSKLNADDIPVVLEEKEQIIKKGGILEYYHTDEQMTHVGGMEVLKDWLSKRVEAFSDKAHAFGLPSPKGVLLMGVQGCGKSLTSKVVASEWKLPLLRLDVGSIFSGIVGSSEENMRKAIKTSETIAPCVLWIDEIEKGFSGIASSNTSDAGATARIFGTFITWLQEKKSPVFVIATANDISSLPPEMLRKGRFDEIFFIDLPTFNERKVIFSIHLEKKKRDPKTFPLEDFARLSEGWSGSEIEQVVIASLFDAYYKNRDLQPDDLRKNLKAMVPLSKTMSEKIDELRNWARTRALPASAPEGSESSQSTKVPVSAGVEAPPLDFRS